MQVLWEGRAQPQHPTSWPPVGCRHLFAELGPMNPSLPPPTSVSHTASGPPGRKGHPPPRADRDPAPPCNQPGPASRALELSVGNPRQPSRGGLLARASAPSLGPALVPYPEGELLELLHLGRQVARASRLGFSWSAESGRGSKRSCRWPAAAPWPPGDPAHRLGDRGRRRCRLLRAWGAGWALQTPCFSLRSARGWGGAHH